ncbi:leucine-rich repeat domain-containing protein [Peribacillus sp. NPDC096540]|uniref:leucine-rich repeat domain-containing protein n=1 Tax=Peribacillus sp. NPDC096540 TaxID=3390612 RepID=UPI003D03FF53
MLFLKEHPHFIFRLGEQPQFVDDLSDVDDSSTELLIQGKTKNIEKLKSFSKLIKLWIYTVNQNEFNTILSLVNPKMLHIYEMRVEDLSIIGSLKDVEVMSLDWNLKATCLWDLSKNSSLKSLSIKDFSKLNDISAIQNSTSLELLDLSGGESKDLKLNNLQPLKYLRNLKYLGLSNIKVQDESLEPICGLKELQELEISNQFPTEEYAKLSVAIPNTKCDKFKPYVHLSSPIEEEDVMVVGKRKPFLNSKVNLQRLQKYEEQFKAFQRKYKG